MAAEITLEECLARAATGNRAINAYVLAREVAENNEISSKAAFYPQLKAKAKYTLVDQPGKIIIESNEFGPGVPEQATNLADDHRDSYQAGFNLLQPLYAGGSLSHTHARSKYQLNGAESDLQYRHELLLEQVKQVFFSALASEKQIVAAEKMLVAQDNLRQIIKELRREGFATMEEVSVAEATFTAAEARLVLLQNELALLLNTLHRLIGAAPGEILKPEGRLEKLQIVVPLDQLLPQDDAGRHDILAKFYQVKQSNEDIAVAESGLYPSISLQGEYMRQRETSVTHSDVWLAQLNAEWNLFDWGKTAAEVRRAAAVNRRDVLALEELRKDAAFEVEMLWRRAETQLSNLQGIEARVKACEWAFRQAFSRSKEGRARQVDVLNAEALLWQEYGAYYTAAATLHGVVAGLERAAGKPLEQGLSRSPLYEPQLEVGESVKVNEGAGSQSEQREHESLSPGTTEPGEAATQQVEMNQIQSRIQFGAFAKRSNAEQLMKTLPSAENDTIKPEIIVEKGLFKVVSRFYKNREEARLAAQSSAIAGFIIRN